MTDQNPDDQGGTALALTNTTQPTAAEQPNGVVHMIGKIKPNPNDVTADTLEMIKSELRTTVLAPLTSAVDKIRAAGVHTDYELDEFTDNILRKYWCLPFEQYAYLVKHHRSEQKRDDLDSLERMFFSKFDPTRHLPTPQSYVDDYIAERAPQVLDNLKLYERDVLVPETERIRHTHIVGTTGAGKTELIKTLIYSHITQQPEAALVVIDPIGDMANEILEWDYWAEHGDRLAFLSPKQFGDNNPVFNPLELPKASDISGFVSMVISELSILVSKDGSSELTGHMQTMVRHCLTVLLQNDCADLETLHAITGTPSQAKPYTDMGKASPDSFVSNYFTHSFDGSSLRATREGLHNRLESILSDTTARHVFSGKSTVDFEALLDEKKVVIFSLGKGRLGKDTTLMFGQSLLGRLHAYAQRRQPIPKSQRHPVHVFLDEAQNYVSPVLAENLDEVRKFGVHFTLAHLHTGQLGAIRETVLQNTTVKLVLQHKKSDPALTEMLNIGKNRITQMERFTAYGHWGNMKKAELFTMDDAILSLPTLDEAALEALITSQVKKYYTNTTQPQKASSKPTRKRELL